MANDEQKDKGQRNIEIAHDPNQLNPTLPVESQLERAGETPPVKDQYEDSPADIGFVTSTHDRDSVQPPDPARTVARVAPEMPLKKKEGQ